MMFYEVTITNSVTYIIDSSLVANEADAIMQSLDLFHESAPTVEIRKVRPCQVGEDCPYEPGSITCSMCGKENN